MAPPHQPPAEGGSQRLPPSWKRARYWLRESDQHPMVQSQADEIVYGTNALLDSFREHRSPSPITREFSRFSSQPVTPDATMHGQSSRQAMRSHPLPLAFPHQLPVPVTPAHQHVPPDAMAHGQHPRQPVYWYPLPPPPPPHPMPAFGVPAHHPAPHITPEGQFHPPINNPPPSGSGAQDPRESPIVSVQFPVDSDIIGVRNTTGGCLWDTRKSFPEFLDEMCKRMQLDKTVVSLGYRLSDDRARAPSKRLSTAEEYEFAMAEIRTKVRRARTKEYKLVLENLRPKQSTAAQKGKLGDKSDPSEAELSRSYFQQLREKLFCKTHRKCCFVRRDASSEHEELDDMALSYWARMIVEREATLDIPPNTSAFDFPLRKRRKTAQQNPTLPAIHVHNHMAGSSARIQNYDVPDTPPRMSPIPPPVIKKRSTSPPLRQSIDLTESHPVEIIDLTSSDADDNEDLNGASYPGISTMLARDGIRYPGIPGMLAELDKEYRSLNFPLYQQILIDNGFAYVSQLVDEQVRQQLQDLGIAIGVVNLLVSRAERVMRRTQKMKQEG